MVGVVISIRPKWCRKILLEEKTIEVRKSKPKLDVPFICYIYCSWGNPQKDGLFYHEYCGYDMEDYSQDFISNGKIIGEFVCDRVYQYASGNTRGTDISDDEMIRMSCLSRRELEAYEFSREPKENCIYLVGLYGWHITNLVTYDQPRTLRNLGLKKAPQSWCYVKSNVKGI